MKRFLALAVFACALSRPALAKDPDVPFAEFRLDNGLRVIVQVPCANLRRQRTSAE